MTGSAHESPLRDAQFRSIRYGLAAIVFALLALAAVIVPDWQDVGGIFGVAALLTVAYSLLTVRRTKVSLDRE